MSTIDVPQNARSRRTRKAIQTAALDILRERGAAAVTMSAVADRAGCSRRALYLHYDSRADLFVSLVEFTNEQEGFIEDVQILDGAKSSVDYLRRVGEFVGRYHVKIAPVMLAIARVRHDDEAAEQSWEAAMADWRWNCEEAIRRLENDGILHSRFATPEDALDWMFALLSVDVLRTLVFERDWNGEKYGHYLGETFVATFVDGRR